MLKEFKDFIARGNVMDLAVGVIVGSAFSKIVSSLVDNILTPLLGIFLGGVDFSGLSIVVKKANINYGMFIQNTIDFFITAFCIFLIVKFINRLNNLGQRVIDKEKKKHGKNTEEEVVEEVPVDENILLLREIRDSLKNNKK